MNTIVIDLNHVTKGVKDFKTYSEKVMDAIDDGIVELYEKTDAKMTREATKYGLSESKLHKTKQIHISDKSFSIGYASPYFKFVEFGTGIVGSANPHPSPEIGWEYDSEGHGDRGWWYPTDNSDPNPYKWLTKDGEVKAWTKGQPSRPILFNSQMWARSQITRILRKHIRGITV